MGESAFHKDYINIIYLQAIKIVPESQTRLILMDGNENLLVKDVPPIISGFRPDLFYEFNDLLIIGEAKTKDDYNTKHSLSQYNAYIDYCSRFNGESYFLLCCPWECTLDLRNIIIGFVGSKEKDINLVFLDEISGDIQCKK